MSSWSDLLQHAEPRQHVVQLYGQDHGALIRSVAAYVAEGLRRREPVLVVATLAHAEGVRRQLEDQGVTLDDSVRFLDAGTLLEVFTVDDGLDWDAFRDIGAKLVGDLCADAPGTKVRVFGEMVGLLWAAGERSKAERLEAFWSRLQETENFSLFCAYPIDPFEAGAEPVALGGVLAAHSHTCAGNGTLFSTMRPRRPDPTGR